MFIIFIGHLPDVDFKMLDAWHHVGERLKELHVAILFVDIKVVHFAKGGQAAQRAIVGNVDGSIVGKKVM